MPSPHRVQSNSRNEGVAHANSPSLGDSVGSWKHLFALGVIPAQGFYLPWSCQVMVC